MFSMEWLLHHRRQEESDVVDVHFKIDAEVTGTEYYGSVEVGQPVILGAFAFAIYIVCRFR